MKNNKNIAIQRNTSVTELFQLNRWRRETIEKTVIYSLFRQEILNGNVHRQNANV